MRLPAVRDTVSTAFLILVLDRVTKYLACKNLPDGQSIKLIPDIFHLTLVFNKGMAFGLFKGERVLFITLSSLIIASVIFYIWKNGHKGVALPLALGLVLGGAIGNLIDRISFGYVIDFLDFRVWPVFNIADSSISVGAIILIWSMLKAEIK